MTSGMGDVISALLSSERAWNRHSRSPQASSAPVPAFAGLTGTERRGQLAGQRSARIVSPEITNHDSRRISNGAFGVRRSDGQLRY